MIPLSLDSFSFSDSDVHHLQDLLEASGSVEGPLVDFGSASFPEIPVRSARHRERAGLQFPDSLLHRFLPVKILGVGGMGAVYLARDQVLRRMVAVKVIQQRSDPVHRERFLREAEGLARLKHENLPTAYSFGETVDGPWMALEFLDGTPLHEVPAPFDFLPAMLQVADALEEIHSRGYVHRDVKPANIILTETGRAVLVDFGLALHAEHTPLTRTGKVVGTMNYLAPEVLAYGAPRPASDFYSWGVTLYALLERRYPFEVPALVTAARHGRPLRPTFEKIDPASPLALMLRRMLSLDPERRPRNRAEIEAILESAREEEPTQYDLPSFPPARPGPAMGQSASEARRKAIETRRNSVSISGPRSSVAPEVRAARPAPRVDLLELALRPVARIVDGVMAFLDAALEHFRNP